MGLKNFLKSFSREFWQYATFIWIFSYGGSIIGFISFIDYLKNVPIIWEILYFIVVFLVPFLIYYFFFYEKRITLLRCYHAKDEDNIPIFFVNSHSETRSKFTFNIGENIRKNNFYLFFTKYNDIKTSFTVPDERYRQISRNNRQFSIFRCPKNSPCETDVVMNSLHLRVTPGKTKFQIHYSIKSPLEKAIKRKKKIIILKINYA